MIRYREALNDLTTYIPGKPIDEVKAELGLEHVTKLASNENPLGCSAKSKAAIKRVLDDVAIYPDGNCTKLRNALAVHLNVDPGCLLFGTGTDEVISMLAQIFIDPDDEMITGAVTFSQYQAGVDSMGGKTVLVPMKDNGFDLDGIVNAITPKTRLIFVCNPNNPTGTTITADEQLDFLNKVPDDIIVVMDEAYYEYVEDKNYPDTIPLLKQYDNLIVLRTFSKIYGLASLRIGYGVMHKDIVNIAERIRKPFNVSATAQEAALAALEDTDFLSLSYMSNQNTKKYIYKALDDLKLSYIPTQSNFIMVDTCYDSKTIFRKLMEKGYIIRPGYPFGLDTHIRITIGTMEQIEGFMSAFAQVLQELVIGDAEL